MVGHESTVLAGNYFALAGEVALVTGASSGLGRQFSRVLAQAGMTVGIAARRKEKLLSLQQEIEALHGQAIPLVMDVTDQRSISDGIGHLVNTAGAISVLVNNAGIALPQRFIDAEPDAVQQVFTTNQQAVWNVAQQVCLHMRQRQTSGRIINIASIAGLRTIGGAASYSVSKAAVVQLTQLMAMELARDNIRVNAIAPGYIATEMNEDFLATESGQKLTSRSPMRRSGTAEELDTVLLTLASPTNSFMTGAVVPVDGGHLVASL